MTKRLGALTLAVLLLLAAIPTAGAVVRVDSYAKARLSEGADVYAGPGYDYVRLGFAGSGGVDRIYGVVENGWVMLGYQFGDQKYRIGYVAPAAYNNLYDIQGTINQNLSFPGAVDTAISGACNLTDDPVMSNSRVIGLADGTPVKLLGIVEGWAHIEVNNGSKYRGFVRTFRVAALVTDTPVRTATPAPEPTVRPTTRPTSYPTVRPTSYPTMQPTAYPTYPPYTPTPGSNTRLSSLRHNCTSTGKLSPGEFNPYQYGYLLTMANTVDFVTLTPTAYNASAYITVNGQYVANGTASQRFYMNDEPQQVTIRVTYGNESSEYTVFLQRRPDERRTRVSIGFINSFYQSGGDWYINADLATIRYYGDDYQSGSLSTYTNTSSSEQYKYAVDPHCIFYYGTMTYPYRATNINDFMRNYNLYGSTLYRIVYIGNKIVAVMPYASDAGTGGMK